MKRTLVLVLALLGLAVSSFAASTATPTFTATNTYTPTPTWTETPIAIKNSSLYRDYFQAAVHLKEADGITAPATTPIPGDSAIYLTNSTGVYSNPLTIYSAAVFGTGTAKGRLQYTVPADYDPDQFSLQLWGLCTFTTATNTAKLCVNVTRQQFNRLTSTAQSMLGVTTNVQTQPNGYRLGQGADKMRWVKFPMPVAITQTTAGDLLNFEIIRTGTNGDLLVHEIEAQYKQRLAKGR